MFWLKLGLILVFVFALISLVKFLLRRLLKIEKVKKKFFSYNHINESHRKIDKFLRIFSTISLITLYSMLLFYREELLYLFFFAMVGFAILDYLIRAFFEWKYTHDPKQSILTVTEMLIIVATIMIVIQFNLLGPY
ncbi:hypothetical protein CSV71_13640 [Sporosarcina sp. P21c]|uniref:DUF4181 domain-containing protein n=1 Tax=unclassified Sporosarcina TaxID=2647733 RepID=UPI000C16986F|nr:MULTISPECIES: DUF4181 domain-containing protein [unclassified Sporosarcina]PIC66094.1 hypothetical protein CSV78_14115 [Sporosarcina sp. P16a]PIC88625.1 hypothetical protein CSV71_13640 [Sporosarcina sp. P21c]PIC91696.1 hypothetical protein CSV70_14095 [Sporosarcina sp. P25]